MSGECGRRGTAATGGNGELANAASATLRKLNSMMRQVTDWRSERLTLESNIRRLKSALKKSGKIPDDALRPDPLVCHQRSEIERLELTVDRLEDEVRGLRAALLESDEAITCSGARRLKERMIKTRREAAEERRALRDEIGHLKVRVREAEEDSSCPSLARLRAKLREIFNGDKRIERVIADVASRSCQAVIDLSNELTRMRELLDESRLENNRVNAENRRLNAALESAVASGRSGDLETIERLRSRVKELEDDSGAAKRAGELEKALGEKEATVTALRNELAGAKTAYRIKSEELDQAIGSGRDYHVLEIALGARDQDLTDLRRQLKLAASMPRDIQRLRDELDGLKRGAFDLEIERDGALDEVEKMRGVVSERNEQIVKILDENEAAKLRCENLEEELGRLNAPLAARVRELEEELAELKRSGSAPTELRGRMEAEDLAARLVERLNKLKSENAGLRNEVEALRREASALKTRETQTENYFDEKLRELEADNAAVKSELGDVIAERDALEYELRRVSCGMEEMRNAIEISGAEIDRLNGAAAEREELRGKLKTAEERLAEVSARFEGIERSLDDLKAENEALKNAVETASAEKAARVRAAEELRPGVEEQSRTLSRRDEGVSKSAPGPSAMDCGDYARADRELKYYIHLQSLAVKRVVDFIGYLDGRASVRPAMARLLEPKTADLTTLNLDENVTATFRMSRKLSARIFEAESDVQGLEALRNERNNVRAERDCLDRGMERLSEMLGKLGREISIPRDVEPAEERRPPSRDGGESCPGEKILDLLQRGPETNGDDEFSGINRRINALQKQIQSKQREAGQRLIEMRETMREERIRLMEIADRANVPLPP